MNYKKHTQQQDFFTILAHQKLINQPNKGINKLKDTIDWESFRDTLETILGYKDRDAKKGGRPPFDPVFMFKILILQKLHNLSDEATEFQIADRFSFMSFLDITPGDAIPDANTIWDFRENLDKDGRGGTKELFDLFSRMLKATGFVAKEGTLVDASFVDAPRQRNTRWENEEIKAGVVPSWMDKSPSVKSQKDFDARWTKKGDETHYGFKNHAKVDLKSKLITGYKATSANVHDSQVLSDLVDKSDNVLLADSAYHSDEINDHLAACGCTDFITHRGYGGKSISKAQVQENKWRNRMRVRVEHVFGRLNQYGSDLVRTIGLKRANQQIGLGNLCYNLERYAYLSV